MKDSAYVAGVAFLNPLTRKLGACEIADDAQLTALEGVRLPALPAPIRPTHPPTRIDTRIDTREDLRGDRLSIPLLVPCVCPQIPNPTPTHPLPTHLYRSQVLVQLGARECVVPRDGPAGPGTPAGRRVRDVLSRCGVLANEQKARVCARVCVRLATRVDAPGCTQLTPT